MFTVEMMAAEYGDALWIEYGNSSHPRIVGVDGGPQTDGSPLLARMRERSEGGASLHIELLIVTHVDADHINGVLAALRSLPPKMTFGDIWFNGFKHLVPRDQLGPETGDLLSKRLVEAGLPWNKAFAADSAPPRAGEAADAVVVHPKGDLPSFDFSGLQVTVLSPTPDKLARLHKVWKSVLKNADVAADRLGDIPANEQETRTEGPDDLLGRSDTWPPDVRTLAAKAPRLDGSESNGSSIGVLAEYREGGKTYGVLLGADCHSPVLESSIDRLLSTRGAEQLPLGAVKLPHHGSRHNLTNALLDKLSCRRYLVSTNGDHFSHPDHEALARVLVKGGREPLLLFNYETKFNQGWKHPPAGSPAYSTEYANGALCLTIA